MPIKLCGSVRCCTNSYAQKNIHMGCELPDSSLLLHRPTLDDSLRDAYAREFKTRDKKSEIVLIAPVSSHSLFGENGKEARRCFGLFVIPLPEDGVNSDDEEEC